MSHREKSLTPWIKPGSVDSDGNVRDDFKTILPPSLYDRAKAEGCDMSWFIRQEPIPLTPEPGSLTRRGTPKKNRDSVSCHNCMPGLGGRCVCCEERD